MNCIDSPEDASGQLGPEGVPHAVLRLALLRVLHSDALLPVDSVPGAQIQGDQGVLLATGDENTLP